MNNFPYTNPYSQKNPYYSQGRGTTTTSTIMQPAAIPTNNTITHNNNNNDTVEAVLEQLERATNTQQRFTLLQQHRISLVTSLEWNLFTAIRLVDWVLCQFQPYHYCATKHDNDDNNDGDTKLMAAVLAFLYACFQIWDDRIIYAVLVHATDDDNDDTPCTTTTKSLLQYLEDLCLLERSRQGNVSVRAVALSTLVLAWEALDRLHQITTLQPGHCHHGSNTTKWWIPHHIIEPNTSWQQLVQTAFQECYKNNSKDNNNSRSSLSEISMASSQNSFLRSEEWKAACAGLLVQLLQHNHVDWMFDASDQALDQWQNNLANEALRLIDPNMPASPYTRLSLVSLQLWMALYQARGMSIVKDASAAAFLLQVVDPVITAALGGGRTMSMAAEPSPRWSQVQQSSLPVSRWSLSVLQSLFCQSPSLLGALQEKILHHCPGIQQCAGMAWETILLQSTSASDGSAKEQQQMSEKDKEKCDIAATQLLLLHRSFRTLTRDSLKRVAENHRQSVPKKMQPTKQHHLIESLYQRIPFVLLRLIRHQDSLWAAGLLSALLNDRRSPVLHDVISRNMWTDIDARFLTQCMELLVTRSTRSSASDYHGPKTICLMDCLFAGLTVDQGLCQSVLSNVSAEVVESFVNILCPKTLRVETTMDTDCPEEYARPIDSEESTPPAHNLSRMVDVSSIVCVEEDQKPRGMDLLIRLSTAAVLATLGTAKQHQQETRITILQQRMCEPLFSFMADINLSLSATVNRSCTSLDMARRHLRFIAAFTDSEHEEQISASLCATQCAQHQSLMSVFKKLERSNMELKESRQREHKLRVEREVSKRRLDQQHLKHARGKNDLERKISFESKQQIAIHWEERVQAEKLAADLRERHDQANAKALEAQASLQTSRESEQRAKSQVEESSRRIAELEQREREACEQLKAKEKELDRTKADAQATQSELRKAFKSITTLEDNIRQQREIIVATEESETELRDSLENLFADMVSLAQIYEVKEEEAASSKANGAIAVDEFKQKLRAEKKRNTDIQEQLDQIRYENEVLSQKYANLREKLERERKTRQRETDLRNRKGSTSYMNQLNISTTSGKSSKSGRRIEGKENEVSLRTASARYRSHSGSYR